MKILLLEPFHEGSHSAWAEGYQRHSRHEVELLTLRGRFWKWRMHGGAVTLARRFLASELNPQLILASDMCDLTTFLALTRQRTASIPTAIYFHENQLSYPWSPDDPDPARGRDLHYAFINYASTLAAHRVFFNSSYHMESFLGALPGFLSSFPDHQELQRVEEIAEKSRVLHLGLELDGLLRDAPRAADQGPPLILWNHRWEYDKNPEAFFRVLAEVAGRGIDFRLAVLGRSYGEAPEVFQRARAEHAERLVHFGHVASRAEYARWLRRAAILPVTSNQDFFGASIVEAIICGAFPLLPRRLTYPELIPEELHPVCLYKDEADLVARLCRVLTEPAAADRTATLKRAMSRFDWRTMAPVYDRALEID